MSLYRRVMVVDRLPKESGFYLTSSGMRYFIESFKKWNVTPLYWLEEVELPSKEEILKESYLPFKEEDIHDQYGEEIFEDSKRFLKGVEYISKFIKNYFPNENNS